MGPPIATLDEVIVEMLRLRKALAPRPSFEELEAALGEINKADAVLASRLEKLFREKRPVGVLPVVFDALQEMRKEVLEHQAREQKKAAEAVVNLEQRHRHYDRLIEKAHSALTSRAESFHSSYQRPEITNDGVSVAELCQEENKGFMHDGDFVLEATGGEKKGPGIVGGTETSMHSSQSEAESSSVASAASMEDPVDKLQLPLKKSASVKGDTVSSLVRSISWTARGEDTDFQPKGAASTDFQQKIAVIPADEKLSTSIDDMEVNGSSKVFNMLDMASKKGTKTLDLHGVFLKELEWVPESLGHLTWLTDLNLSGNRLTSLPDSLGELCNLTNLDLSANQLTFLPESIGCLLSLTTLNIEKNRIEELPWTIGQCTSLVELYADFNQLKALPEAVGKLGNLQHLSVHLNCLKSLPTTIASMTSLMELDVHFNELESVPESLCLVTTLKRLDLSSNFTDLNELPQFIGRLQKLKDLNISYNHISVLPDSFIMLTNLEVLHLEGNPWQIPPLHVVEEGKEAVFQYMIDYVGQKENQNRRSKKRGKMTILLSSIVKLMKRSRKSAKEYLDIRA